MEGNLMLEPEHILQKLVNINTVNPPGNELQCIEYMKGLFDDAGIETKILAKDPNRPNLLVRLLGSGEKPPILLYGHVDTVPATGQEWSVDPFAGLIKDGCIWGRGTLDMKGLLTMFICAVLRLKAEKADLPFDIMLLCLSDEEDTGEYGAKYICENHAELFSGVKYALGELGGFSMYVSGKKFYPVMVSEKQCAHLKVTFKGRGGHGSTIQKNSALTQLGEALSILAKKRLPLHVSEEAKVMLLSIASQIGFKGLILKQALNPLLSDKILDLLGEDGRYFDAILHNTVNATIIRNENNSVNVIPAEAAFELDTRLVPGQKIEAVVEELRVLLGDGCNIEVINYDPGAETVDYSAFDALAGVLKEMDPDGIPIPYIMSGVTDGRFFSKLGIQTYGFTPMNLPEDFPFIDLIHGADERLPIDALHFGIAAVYKFLLSYDG